MAINVIFEQNHKWESVRLDVGLLFLMKVYNDNICNYDQGKNHHIELIELY